MSVSISVMTFNLHEGDLPSDSPNSWEKRKDLCVSVITNYSPTILCTQQGLKWQLEYFQQCLPGKDLKIPQMSIAQSSMTRRRLSFLKAVHSGCRNHLLFQEAYRGELQCHPLLHGLYPIIFVLTKQRVEPPGFSFQIVNTNLDEFSPRARRRSALLTWQHIASLPPNLPVIYCGGFNSQKESTTGRFLLGRSREHGVVGDMRDAWPNARARKNVSLIRTYHGFKGDKQGAVEFLKLIFRALCLCWDRQTQDLHVDWILFRGRSLVPATCEVVNNNIDGFYPSSHYPVYAEFMLPRNVRLVETS
ncbi:hypothetical protein ZIOFF_068603 [Zingiber officinale]|uniref:Endonuclease/exonuclease/phosphatase domain-containing protein n=1 Tax=Zingiber officinale TaxID=94328 RepID=A0A8J5ETE0_ZINOF|nr:hypothetical protein ZIOFF_068603 [Zingiber officinale]